MMPVWDDGPEGPESSDPIRSITVICLQAAAGPPSTPAVMRHCCLCGVPVWLDVDLHATRCICMPCAVRSGAGGGAEIHPSTRDKLRRIGMTDADIDGIQALINAIVRRRSMVVSRPGNA